GPVVGPDRERQVIGALGVEPRHLLRGVQELLAALVIGRRIAGAHEGLHTVAEDGDEPRLVVCTTRRQERVDGGLRRRESLLPPRRSRLGRWTMGRAAREDERRRGDREQDLP